MTQRKRTTLEKAIVSESLSPSLSQPQERKKGERNPINETEIQLCVGAE